MKARRAETPVHLAELPWSALTVTVLVGLATIGHLGSAGWLLTVPLVCLAAHLWPHLTLVAPLAGLALSAALFTLAALIGAPGVPLVATGAVYLAVAYSAVLLNVPRRALERQLADTERRAAEDQQALQVMARLAQLSARSDLNLTQAASCALQLLHPVVPLGGAALLRAPHEAVLGEDVLLGGTPDLPVPAGWWLGPEAHTATFRDHTACDTPHALALLPLAGGEAPVVLLAVRGGHAPRWSVQDRQLLTAAARAASGAAGAAGGAGGPRAPRRPHRLPEPPRLHARHGRPGRHAARAAVRNRTAGPGRLQGAERSLRARARR